MPDYAYGKLLNIYNDKLKHLSANERLFIRLRWIMTHRNMEKTEAHLNLIKSFQQAIKLERAELIKLQSEIERMIEP